MATLRTTMRWMTATLAALVLGAAIPAGLHAQLAINRSNEKLLVLAPQPANPADSSFAMAVAAAIRDQMTQKFRYRLAIITTDATCELLHKSGYSCGSDAQAEQIARYLSATGLLMGWMHKSADSLHFDFRLVDVGGSGLSGWFRIAASANSEPGDIGQIVADNMDNQVKAASSARDCQDKLSSSDYSGARDKAYDAFKYYPDQPSAARCLALVFEAQHAPVDSQVQALERAVRGDSLNASIWEDLSRKYMDAKDSAKAMDALMHELKLRPENARLRLGIAAGLMQQGRYQEAVVQLDTLLQAQPNDVQLLHLKERSCLQGSLWPCAIDALAQEFNTDSALAQDTIFYAKIFSAAQSANDTAAMLKWSGEAVKNLPTSLRMWQARTAALTAAGMHDSLIVAYNKMLKLDPTQVPVALAEAQLLLDSTLVIDTTVPLDTARMAHADSLMQFVLRQNPDSATRMSIALLYYSPASKMVQQRVDLPLAAKWLERSLENDVQHRLTRPANFFLGLAYAFQVVDLDKRVRATKSCSLVDVEAALVRKAIPALTTGRSVSSRVADQLLGYMRQVQKALPTYKPYFKCK